VSLRDTLLQLGFVLIAGGAVFATWALLTGPLARLVRTTESEATREDATPETADDPRTGSSEEPS
jgi:hypothetical protein